MEIGKLLRKKWGQEVRRHRLARELTQEKLAELIGIDQSTVSRVETGDFRTVEPELMLRFAVVLEVEPELLFGWPFGIRAIAADQMSRAS